MPRVYAPAPFRWTDGQDYPYGYFDLADDSKARAMKTAGKAFDGPGDAAAAAVASSVSGAGRAPYLGVPATRCYAPNVGSGNQQAMSRTMHIARDKITALQLMYANWTIASGETANGGVSSFRAAIEYPAGTINGQALFGGAVTGTAASGASVTSDMITLLAAIPKGAKFWVRTWSSNPNGQSFVNTIGATGVDMISASNSQADWTMTPGSNPGAATTTILPPLAILGYTTNPSFLITGDSINHGSGDSNAATDNGDQGMTARSVGLLGGYISVAMPGESVATFVAGHANRLPLAQFCTHVMSDYGTQDLGNGEATWLANMTTFVSYFAGKPVYLSTLIPRTTSTDAWVTAANQTVTANEAARVAINQDIRAGIVPGVTGYFDTERILESTFRSGKWNSPAGVALTADGTHPNQQGYLLVKDAGVFNPALLK